MENLQVMGFLDVLVALPKLCRQFYQIRDKILELKPKAVICIDYPGFHLKLAKSLKKKGFKGKLIHMVAPTVWAWKKGRIPQMAQTLDLLLTFFPFEPQCFAHTPLPTHYVGHPLSSAVQNFQPKGQFLGQKILGIFPGSRKTEIERNLPIQLAVAKRLQQMDPSFKIVISNAQDPIEQNYELMRASYLALATSGTVTLELALHNTPTIVSFAIRRLDCFIAQKIFRINLPFYCIANIVVNKQVFPEFFGPNFTEEALFLAARSLACDERLRKICQTGCGEVRQALGQTEAAKEAAIKIFSSVDF